MTDMHDIYLHNLRTLRVDKGITIANLVDLTDIPVARLRNLESHDIRRRVEPWLDEAYRIARVLSPAGIGPIVSDHLTSMPAGTDPRDDFDVWRIGARLPLSTAVRLTFRFGLDDPEELVTWPRHKQLWAVLEASERNPEASGWCPWCAADIVGGDPHLPTCLPHNIWGAPKTLPSTAIYSTPRTASPGMRRKGGSKGAGLRVLREMMKLTQKDMATVCEIAVNHYAMMERGDRPLTYGTAEMLALKFKIDRALLYTIHWPADVRLKLPPAVERALPLDVRRTIAQPQRP